MLRVILTLATLVAAGLAAARLQSLAKDPERHALYHWFDSLGLDAFRSGEFVEIQPTYILGNHRDALPPKFGFLEARDGEDFRVRLPELGVDDLASEQATSGKVEVALAPADLNAWLRNRCSRGRIRFSKPYFLSEAAKVELFVLARVSDLHGLDLEADEFYRYFADAGVNTPGDRFDCRPPPAADVRREVAELLEDWAKCSFGDVRVSRNEVLSRFSLVRDKFGEGKNQQEAAMFAAELQQEVSGDAVRRPLTEEKLSRLPIEAQARELFWQLRDQDRPPGFEDIFSMAYGFGYVDDDPRPVSRLSRLGWPAIPAVIDALGDPRHIRVVARRGALVATDSEVMRVRDAALEILNRMAQNKVVDTREEVMDDLEAAKVSSVAAEWWRKVSKKGETRYIAEIATQGGYRSAEAARRLVKANAPDAVAAIESGIRNATDSHPQAGIISTLGGLKAAAASRLALDQIGHGADLGARQAAIRQCRTQEPHRRCKPPGSARPRGSKWIPSLRAERRAIEWRAALDWEGQAEEV